MIQSGSRKPEKSSLLLPQPPLGASPSLWEASPLGFPSLEMRGSDPQSPRNLCRQASSPHGSQGSRRLVPVPHLPTPNPQTPGTGSQPSFVMVFWRQAPCSLFPQALPFTGTPEGPCPYSSRYPQTDSPPNRDPRGRSSPFSINALSSTPHKGPQHNPLPVTAHREPGGQALSTFPPEAQGPG